MIARVTNQKGNIVFKRTTAFFIAILFGGLIGVNAFPIKAHAAGVIEINDCLELQQIGINNDYPLASDYVLGNNIDCSDSNPSAPNYNIAQWDSSGFVPIGSYVNRFSGNFDGNNFTISNLFINRPGTYNVGLFGVIDEGATVTNLNLTDVNITGRGDVGALAGGLVGHVENINATGTVNGSDNNVGGLVGQHVPVNNLDNSSPEVFTWNGTKYTYVADVGRQLPKETSGVDLAKIDNTNLVPKDGKYSMKIAQEYNEIVYFDQLSLRTFDHAPGYTVVQPLFRNSTEADLHTVSNTPTNPLLACEDMYNNNCKNDLESYDSTWAHEDPSFDNCWTMDFGDLSASKDTNVQLLMRGARSYDKKPTTQMRSVSVKDANGNWSQVYDKSNLRSDGTPRLRSINLTGKFKSSDYRVKVCLDTYQVNYFAIDTSAQVPFTTNTYQPDSAELGYHGFTAIDRTHYPLHDYDQVSDKPEAMLQSQYGNFTKYGDVKPLLSSSDNHFVVMHYGDQMSVEFPYNSPAPGTERSFILSNDAFYKHANLGAIGRTVNPMPYHGMGTFDANTQYPQTPENLAYQAEWNTRRFDGTGKTGGSTIVNSTANVAVTSTSSVVGGIVGRNAKPVINSHSYGDVSGGNNVGGIAGYNYNSGDSHGDISNSSASGSITGYYYIGGIIGNADGGSLTDSYADGPEVHAINNQGGGVIGNASNIQISNSYSEVGLVVGGAFVGGFVGAQDSNSLIENSYTTSSVQAGSMSGGFAGLLNGGSVYRSYSTGAIAGTGNQIGGFIGSLYNGNIFDDYSTGNVTAAQGYAGGFAGTMYGGSAQRNYASGSVNADAGEVKAGGFAGQIRYLYNGSLNIMDSFSAGEVTGPNQLGGFVGSFYPDVENLSFDNNHYDEAGAGMSHCAPSDDAVPGCTGQDSPNVFKSSADQPISSTWDTENTWDFSAQLNDGYPCLRWQLGCNVTTSVDLVSAEDSSPIVLSQLGCENQDSGTLKESSLSFQDGDYTYPSGLVDFTLSNCARGGSSIITATFAGSYDPATVMIRKFNSRLGTYETLTPANSKLTTATTTLDGKPALRVTYWITDGGEFDSDGLVNGQIVDPVGIAKALTVTTKITGVGVPNTGIERLQ